MAIKETVKQRRKLLVYIALVGEVDKATCVSYSHVMWLDWLLNKITLKCLCSQTGNLWNHTDALNIVFLWFQPHTFSCALLNCFCIRLASTLLPSFRADADLALCHVLLLDFFLNNVLLDTQITWPALENKRTFLSKWQLTGVFTYVYILSKQTFFPQSIKVLSFSGSCINALCRPRESYL